MTIFKNNSVRFILVVSLLLAGSVWSSMYASKNPSGMDFSNYESFIWAALFLLMSIFLIYNKGNSHIYAICIYIFFYVLQLLAIWDLLKEHEIWMYVAILLDAIASIGFLYYFKKMDFHQELIVSSVKRVLFSILVVFFLDISKAILVFMPLDLIDKFMLSIANLFHMKDHMPFNLVNSLIGLCIFFLLIKFLMKIKIKDFLKRIGILSMNDLKTGLFVFISIILFLQVAEIALNLFLEHSFFKVYYFDRFTETRLIPMFDVFGVGLYEEIVYRGFLFYIVLCTVNKSNKSIMNPIIVIILSQAIFSLSHLPRMIIYSEFSNLYIIYDLARIFVTGFFFIIIYIRTKSIYAAIFIHTLMNYYGSPLYSGALLISPNAQRFLLYLFVFTLLLFWDYLPIFNKSQFKQGSRLS